MNKYTFITSGDEDLHLDLNGRPLPQRGDVVWNDGTCLGKVVMIEFNYMPDDTDITFYMERDAHECPE